MNAIVPRLTPLDFIWVELTNQCNLECVHCYASSGPQAGHDDALDHGHYVGIVADAFEQGCRRIQFIGGEASLYRRLPELLTLAHSLGYEDIEVYTNLISLPDPLIEVLSQGHVRVATSIYSHEAAIHDAITTRPGSWARTVSNLKRLLALGVDCRASVILMDRNHDAFAPTKLFLRQIGVTSISNDKARPFGRAAEAHACSDMGELCGKCADGVLCVSSTGKVYPCIMSRAWEVGQVLDTPIGDILRSGPLEDFRTELIELKAGATPLKLDAEWCGPDSPCSPCSPAECSPGRECNPHAWPRPTAIPEAVATDV